MLTQRVTILITTENSNHCQKTTKTSLEGISPDNPTPSV